MIEHDPRLLVLVPITVIATIYATYKWLSADAAYFGHGGDSYGHVKAVAGVGIAAMLWLQWWYGVMPPLRAWMVFGVSLIALLMLDPYRVRRWAHWFDA